MKTGDVLLPCGLNFSWKASSLGLPTCSPAGRLSGRREGSRWSMINTPEATHQTKIAAVVGHLIRNRLRGHLTRPRLAAAHSNKKDTLVRKRKKKLNCHLTLK